MKLHKILASVAALVLVVGCQQVDKMQALPADQIASPKLDEHTDVLIDHDNLASPITFTWSAVDYGYPAAVKYALWGVYGDGEPYQIGESNTTSFTVTKEVFNNTIVNKKGLKVPEEKTSQLYLYLTASISDNNKAYTYSSNTIGFMVTTIKSTSAAWIRRVLYVPGSHNGWAPGNAPVVWETGENSNVYEGLVLLGNAGDPTNMTECEFKFTSQPNWDGPNYGGSLEALNPDGGAANLKIAPGVYWFSVNLNELTAKNKITILGVIGDAIGGWGDADDLILTPDGQPAPIADPSDEEKAAYQAAFEASANAQIFSGVCAATASGEYKFRLDHAWTTSWGSDLKHLAPGGGNLNNSVEGSVKFSMDFRGNLSVLLEDTTNPWPYSGKVEALTE